MKLNKGFSLIELMIVVAIIGVLSLMALPFYQDYVIRVKITEKLVQHKYLIDAYLNEYESGGVDGLNSWILSSCTDTPVIVDDQNFVNGIHVQCKTNIGIFPDSDLNYYSNGGVHPLLYVRKNGIGSNPNDFIYQSVSINQSGDVYENFSSINFKLSDITPEEGFTFILFKAPKHGEYGISANMYLIAKDGSVSTNLDNKWYCASGDVGSFGYPEPLDKRYRPKACPYGTIGENYMIED